MGSSLQRGLLCAPEPWSGKAHPHPHCLHEGFSGSSYRCPTPAPVLGLDSETPCISLQSVFTTVMPQGSVLDVQTQDDLCPHLLLAVAPCGHCLCPHGLGLGV